MGPRRCAPQFRRRMSEFQSVGSTTASKFLAAATRQDPERRRRLPSNGPAMRRRRQATQVENSTSVLAAAWRPSLRARKRRWSGRDSENAAPQEAPHLLRLTGFFGKARILTLRGRRDFKFSGATACRELKREPGRQIASWPCFAGRPRGQRGQDRLAIAAGIASETIQANLPSRRASLGVGRASPAPTAFPLRRSKPRPETREAPRCRA